MGKIYSVKHKRYFELSNINKAVNEYRKNHSQKGYSIYLNILTGEILADFESNVDLFICHDIAGTILLEKYKDMNIKENIKFKAINRKNIYKYCIDIIENYINLLNEKEDNNNEQS